MLTCSQQGWVVNKGGDNKALILSEQPFGTFPFPQFKYRNWFGFLIKNSPNTSDNVITAVLQNPDNH
ncbi:hypothetical protein DP115_27590 [Brasilonema octagenarum UFV-OR1]|uniref:Uncharacterized protein n=1 Tax=Brasilonema octagenarum UFV-OR1 TaxID=417115 RepID=A0ABX1MKB8_9CYAN|nr:hypothetical protein [Brasilonema octagenarum UFV-OR1]